MAKILNRPDRLPFDEVEEVGVALKIHRREPEQVHIGLLYKLDEGAARLCHFAADLDLRDEKPTLDYSWAQCALDQVLRRLVASACASIVANKNPIRYGFPYQPPYFSADKYEFVQRPLGEGVTCATFVLAVFKIFDIDLLEIATWPPASPQDMLWQVTIANSQRHKMVGDAMAQHMGAKRFLPQEVAAGVVSKHVPINYEAARPIADKIIEELRKVA